LANIPSPAVAFSTRQAVGCALAFEIWRRPSALKATGGRGNWRSPSRGMMSCSVSFRFGRMRPRSKNPAMKAIATSSISGFTVGCGSPITRTFGGSGSVRGWKVPGAYGRQRGTLRSAVAQYRHRCLRFPDRVPRVLSEGQPHNIDVVDTGVFLTRRSSAPDGKRPHTRLRIET